MRISDNVRDCNISDTRSSKPSSQGGGPKRNKIHQCRGLVLAQTQVNLD